MTYDSRRLFEISVSLSQKDQEDIRVKCYSKYLYRTKIMLVKYFRKLLKMYIYLWIASLKTKWFFFQVFITLTCIFFYKLVRQKFVIREWVVWTIFSLVWSSLQLHNHFKLIYLFISTDKTVYKKNSKKSINDMLHTAWYGNY